MNSPFRFSLSLWVIVLASAALGAGVTNNPAKKTGESGGARTREDDTNAIPKSVFVMPANPEQGRDPFFPLSTRFRAAPPVVQQPPPVAPVRLKLQGISGTPDNRLAIINGRTMAAGESAEFNMPGGKITARCVEVRADSCVIEIGTERQELRLNVD
ncbi:MAG TPA: hypothetical protein GYA07_02985 [Verrucomicrobia bacterium]|nr:hypothetical protein [Verrucomicrobiota bacterium]HOB32723.1 hypothetical protein [Verrucomicrobiota bacterium]HOP97839.1 hypothetical protein [Verrucomicrobiota bacterium]HPU57319.1 hypothetical protein [Verrucomicrobiota bacterium]